MKNLGMTLSTMVGGLASLVFASSDASADPRMVVLIDASGSMSISRPNDTVTPTRFDAAKAAAVEEVQAQAQISDPFHPLRVAVYTFSDSSSTNRTATPTNPLGYVDPGSAITAIEGFNLFSVGGGSTPLAGGMCDSMVQLLESGGSPKLLHVTSDGEENSTLTNHPCWGPFSGSATPPYTDGSWHKKVRDFAVDNNVAVTVELFAFSLNVSNATNVAHDPEAAITAKARAQGGPQTAAAPTLTEFFGELAEATGGQLRVIADTAPLPVSGDLNGDRCVDRTDALSLARAFGPVASNRAFDINHDGVIGYADYSFVASQIGNGCLTPPVDPYVASGPLVCPANGGTLTIDGKAVTGSSFAVTGGNNCRIVIKNSLIVGDVAGISMSGNNRVTVDNSIIVGNGVIKISGFTRLSTAKTIFHGAKLEPDGSLEYYDRGGNVWEE